MSQLGNFANFLLIFLWGLPAGIILKKKDISLSRSYCYCRRFYWCWHSTSFGMMPYEKGGDFVPVFMVYLTGAFCFRFFNVNA
jgi:FHS family L-fucose permease-like MFS transporter